MGQNSPGIRIAISLLAGVFLALVPASIYTLYQYQALRIQIEQLRTGQRELKDEIVQIGDQLRTEISRVHADASSAMNETNRSSGESLKNQIAQAMRQANALAGAEKAAQLRVIEDLKSRLARNETASAQQISQVRDEVEQVRNEAGAAKEQVGQVSNTIVNLESKVVVQRSELDKAILGLRSVMGDLGQQSGLIATNQRELALLKERGERAYDEFTLQKGKNFITVAGIRLRLKSIDTKKNRYTLDVLADDKVIEKKDKTVNEPVQFHFSRSTAVLELVINDIAKDRVSGYVSSPKPTHARK